MIPPCRVCFSGVKLMSSGGCASYVNGPCNRAWHIKLATSYVAIQLTRREFKMRRMTWRLAHTASRIKACHICQGLRAQNTSDYVARNGHGRNCLVRHRIR